MAFQAEEQNHNADKHFREAWGLRENYSGRPGGPYDTGQDYSNEMFYWDQ